MRLDKLEIELRPRTHPQALDLGLALLRAHAASAYAAWLALWLPVMALCTLASWLLPAWTALWLALAWWCKPLLERAPLYVFSRGVFGEAVGWRQAVRAWPRQLGGGWLELMTWGRLLGAGRGLAQPVWQLEGARGKFARERRRALRRGGSGAAAFWFGIVCAHFEVVLQLGLLAMLGFFMANGESLNPVYLLMPDSGVDAATLRLLAVAAFGFGAAIIGPIYTACTFTLYLNRRARLEAWDIEIVLRQLAAPPARAKQPLAAQVLALLLALTMLLPAAPSYAAHDPCATGQLQGQPELARSVPADAAQSALRRELDQLYTDAELRGYDCAESWFLKRGDRKSAAPDLPFLDLLAQLAKAVAIAAAFGICAWLLYRYRAKFPALRGRAPRPATEVGGLDIRASSLPEDVAATAQALWDAGERRAALALLYRATLSRLVEVDGLQLHQGATEDDCLRLARAQLQAPRYATVAAVTGLWLGGAYADRWPQRAAVLAQCAAWQSQFGQPT
ncbi:MAG: hypothetical protein V4508_00590 [Pseudomonadota bacterium]